jgi:hypothetical protein
MDNINLPSPIPVSELTPNRENHYIDKVQKAIKSCASDIARVSRLSANIKAQDGWDSFWKKGENIKLLADNLGVLASVNQRTLDMLVLLIGATGRVKSDYNILIESIDELSKSHSGSVQVLDYLVKIKNTVEEMKRRDELLESLVTYSNDLRESLSSLDNTTSKSLSDLSAKHASIIQRQSEQDKRISELSIQNAIIKTEFSNNISLFQSQIETEMRELTGSLSKRLKFVWIFLSIALLTSVITIAIRIL